MPYSKYCTDALVRGGYFCAAKPPGAIQSVSRSDTSDTDFDGSLAN
jgi:hypothetical protein